MTKCNVCGLEMLSACGCTIGKLYANGKRYERVKVGAVGDFLYDAKQGCRCGDCGAVIGHFHHWGCDCERCPACGMQLISCDCEDVYIEVGEKQGVENG